MRNKHWHRMASITGESEICVQLYENCYERIQITTLHPVYLCDLCKGFDSAPKAVLLTWEEDYVYLQFHNCTMIPTKLLSLLFHPS